MPLLTSALGSGALGFFPLGGPVDIAVLFPNGTDVYFGLFEELPDAVGVGGVEMDVDRTAVRRWMWKAAGVRTNVAPIRITAIEHRPLAGWGVWDAATAGNLIAVIPWSPGGAIDILDSISAGETAEIQAQGLYITSLVLDAESNINHDDYGVQAADLLPPGSAWTGTRLGQFLTAVVREFSRVEWRARRLIEEADPRTTQELLSEWEEFAGLPDACGGTPPETVAGRQEALVAKLTRNVSPTPQAFIDLAEALGYTGVIITLNGNPFTCISNCNDSLYGAQWIYTFTITVDASSENDATLECLARALAPAHTTVLFEYGA